MTINARFNGYISLAAGSATAGTQLTVLSVTNGTIAIGQNIKGAGVAAGTRITAGSGLVWTVNTSQSVGATAGIALTGEVPFRTNDFQNPTPKKYVQPPEQDFLRQRVIERPDNQTDWPNPQPARYPGWIHTFAGSVLALGLLVSVPPKPFIQDAIDPPVPAKVYAQTDQVSVNVKLLSPRPDSQSEWVTPPPKVYAQPDVVENLSIGRLLSTKPFKQSEWVTPPAKVYPAQQWEDSLRQLVVAPPNRQTDQPNPTLAKVYAQPDVVQNTLLRQAAPPAPFVQEDWGTPPAKGYPQPDVVQNTSIGRLLSTKPFKQSEWVTPPPKVYAQPDVVQNTSIGRLLSTKPFSQSEWVTPPAKVYPPQKWEDSLRQLVVAPPNRQTDQPNPTLAKVYAQPDVVQNTLLRQVALVYPPFKQSEWATPPAKVYPQPDVVQNSTIRQVNPAPFKQSEWVTPPAKVYPPQKWEDSLRQLVVAPPNRQTDQPNPTLAKVYPQPDVVQNTLLRQVALVYPPFRQLDWQNPLLFKYPVQAWEDSLRQLVVAPPNRQTDQPNPTLAKVYPQPDVVQNKTIRQVAPVVNPFRQTDWQNPTLRKPPVQAWEDSLRQLNLAAPFRQTEWVTPPAKQHAQPVVVQNSTIRMVAPAAAALPFRLLDQPNPQVRVHAQQYFVNNTLVFRPVLAAPFRQLDWQNPTLRRVAQQPAPYERGITAIIVPVTGVSGFGTIGQVTVTIVNLWNPVDDGQTPDWGQIPDSQTPNWTPVVDSQPSSWSAINDSQTPNWASVDDAQAASWSSVNDSQTPNWGTVDDSQPSNWTPVNDAQTAGWSAVPDTQVVVWTNVDDSQAGAWTPVDDSQDPGWT